MAQTHDDRSRPASSVAGLPVTSRRATAGTRWSSGRCGNSGDGLASATGAADALCCDAGRSARSRSASVLRADAGRSVGPAPGRLAGAWRALDDAAPASIAQQRCGATGPLSSRSGGPPDRSVGCETPDSIERWVDLCGTSNHCARGYGRHPDRHPERRGRRRRRQPWPSTAGPRSRRSPSALTPARLGNFDVDAHDQDDSAVHRQRPRDPR